MEKIERRNGQLYYGEKPCHNADEAYALYREDYHKSLGRQVYKQLDRVGQRTERTHGIGYYFSWREQPDSKEFLYCKRTRYYVMGLLGISYCYMVGSWDIPEHNTEADFDRWYNWAFDHNSNGLVLAGWRKYGSGRNSKEYLKQLEKRRLYNKQSYGRRKERTSAQTQL